ncbi:hypothetical protein [Bremerella cremea]|nr:hypothetical protein [Bremerella cremea]
MFSWDLFSPSVRIRSLENSLAKSAAQLEKAEAEMQEFEVLNTEAMQELAEIQQLVLQRVQEGVPVPIDATFVDVADPQLIDKIVQAYRPMLDSPNPYHQKAAAQSLSELLRDSPEQLRTILPQVVKIYVDSEVNEIDRFSEINDIPFQEAILEPAIAELQTYLNQTDPKIRIAAAGLLLEVTWSDPKQREHFQRPLLEALRPIVEESEDEFRRMRAAEIAAAMQPEPAKWLPLLRERSERAPEWQRSQWGDAMLQIDPQDEYAIQLLLDIIVQDKLNWEYAQSILTQDASETAVRQAIQKILKEQKLSEGKQTFLLSMLDEMERNQAKATQ